MTCLPWPAEVDGRWSRSPTSTVFVGTCRDGTFTHTDTHTHTHTHTHKHTVLRLSGFCPRQPGWAGTRRNIHSLTPSM